MQSMVLPNWLRDLSISRKFSLSILGTSTIAVLLAVVAIATMQWFSARNALERDLLSLAKVVAANSTAAISFSDSGAAQENLHALKVRPNVVLACLYDTGRGGFRLFAAYEPTKMQCSHEYRAGSLSAQEAIFASSVVEFQGERLGELQIHENDAALWAGLRTNLMALGTVLLVCLLVAYVITNILQGLITGPILNLARTSTRISASKDYSIRAPQAGRDEVGSLVDAFNKMITAVEQAQQELNAANADLAAQVNERNRANTALQETLDQLRCTQDQLVQTEKLASLGGLVAGVAHEINTPIGIGVTAASTLSARSEEIRSAFEAETLSANGLANYLEVAGQSTSIILNNLERAASLIQSFKQVAVDQSNLDHRRFLIRDYVEELLLSLRPKFKHTQIQIDLECDEKLSINTYPGVLSQILTNLLMNVLIHAYDEGEKGQVSIVFSAIDDGMNLHFSDNGCGIPSHNLSKIFDPFFTTRRGSGGSGLGMHIVYNLVTQKLGGHIKVESREGEGAHFHLYIPEIKEISHAGQG